MGGLVAGDRIRNRMLLICASGINGLVGFLGRVGRIGKISGFGRSVPVVVLMLTKHVQGFGGLGEDAEGFGATHIRVAVAICRA
jgi:hypothetical protein